MQKATTHEQYLSASCGSSAEIVRYETLPKAQADLVAGKVDLVFARRHGPVGGLPEDRQGQGFRVRRPGPALVRQRHRDRRAQGPGRTSWRSLNQALARSAPTAPTTRSPASTSTSRSAWQRHHAIGDAGSERPGRAPGRALDRQPGSCSRRSGQSVACCRPCRAARCGVAAPSRRRPAPDGPGRRASAAACGAGDCGRAVVLDVAHARDLLRDVLGPTARAAAVDRAAST